ncbi:MAG: hypothetical protein LKJ76_05235 [Lachnospiraceae bacterium]|jgi:hypothetical protein|nr:hypothetical protein [Lachnospiraceae bacterium]
MKKSVRVFYITVFAAAVALPLLLSAVFGKMTVSADSENRQLAQRPVLSAATLTTYPNLFESYFSDNLPFRDALLTVNGLAEYKVLHSTQSDSVIIGKKGWLFYKGSQVNGEDPIADYEGTNLFTEEQLQQIAQNMTAARDELSSRGMQFVIMVCPNKERAYAEYMPDSYGRLTSRGREDQVVEYLQKNTDLTVVCPYETIEDYKAANPQDQLYYKYDTHWNNLGSYIGARELLKTLDVEELPDLSTVERSDGHVPVYDLARLLHLGNQLKDDPAPVLEGIAEHAITSEHNDALTVFRYTCTDGGEDDRKVFIIGDSFSTMMAPYVALRFNNVYEGFYYNYALSQLEEEQPKIVIYETVERYLNNMLNFSITTGIGAKQAAAQ